MKRIKISLIIAVCTLLLLTPTAAYAADYTVVPNDSLFKISQLFNTSINKLKQDNSLQSDTIYPGQVLSVSAAQYTVKSGDTLYLIAKRYGITLTALMRANNNIGSYIVPGQILTIPQAAPASGSGTVISYTKTEVDLLARLIEAEASGESYNAKVGVGAVVVNRVQSKEWAPTITDVIYQKYNSYYQFTPVQNGMINKPASSDSIKAAWAALYGSDPSNGAIYYYDKTTTNQWILSKTVTAKIDNMTFVK